MPENTKDFFTREGEKKTRNLPAKNQSPDGDKRATIKEIKIVCLV